MKWLRWGQAVAGRIATARSSASNRHVHAVPDTAYRCDPRRAADAYRTGRRAIERGHVDEAHAAALDAIRAHPGWHRGYQLLGEVQACRGNAELASACRSGLLPAGIWPDVVVPDAGEPRFERIRVFDKTRRSIAAAGSLQAPPYPGFAARTLVIRESFVDRVPAGRLWHDAHNTLVRDADGRTLPKHTVGSEALVRDLSTSSTPMSLGRRAVLLGSRGGGNYYHWMLDILPKLGLLERAGFERRPDDIFIVPFEKSRFQRASLDCLGIEDYQIYFAEANSPDITADELLVPYLRNNMGLHMHRSVPDWLADAFGPGDSVVPHRRIFVSRDTRQSQGRGLANATAVHELFDRRGFEIVYPERLDVRGQAALFASAEMVAGIHGAGLANIVHCRPGTAVLEFFGEHIAPCYWAISALRGLHYYHHHCSPEGSTGSSDTPAERRTADLGIPLVEAEALIDRLEADMGHRSNAA